MSSIFAALVLAGCATNGEPAADAPESPAAPAVHAVEDARVEFAGSGRLGAVVRTINEQIGGGLVLMAGLESRNVPEVRFAHVTVEEAARGLADATGCAVQATPNYYFIYSPGYEALHQLSLVGRTGDRYDQMLASMSFGYGTELFNIFKWVSLALDITIVGDQVVASAECGEMALGEIPLREGLEAVLKSARVAGVEVQATEDYIFLYTPGRTLPDTALLQADRLDATKQRYLLNRVSLFLPKPPANPNQLDIEFGAFPLHELLPSLSSQLGARIVATDRAKHLPVNPLAMHNIPIADAMNLLIWQWPVGAFGYQVTEDRIVIRER